MTKKIIGMRLLALLIMCVATLSSFAQDLSLAGRETPYGFILNKGQVVDQDGAPNNAVRYMLLRPGLNVQVKDGGFSYDTYTREIQNGGKESRGRIHANESALVKYHRVDISFPGSNPDTELVAIGMSPDPINYIGERDVTTNHYSQVLYKNLYDGIDLKLYTNSQGAFEYDFIVRPGADPSQISIDFAGQNNLFAAGDKAISIIVRQGELREQIPASYLAISKKDVDVKFTLPNNHSVAFDVPAYDRSQTLIIDPQPNLLWATYYGGSLEDGIEAITTDASNNVYVGGYTYSANGSNIIATSGVSQTALNTGPDGFFAVFNASGVRQLGGYYGGPGDDYILGILVNPAGEIFVTGHTTSSSGMGLVGGSGSPYSQFFLGGTDAFLGKFSAAGVRLWGTYFGGGDVDKAFDMFFDAGNNPVIVGTTSSTSVSSPPLSMSPGTYQTVYGGGASDAFIASFTSAAGARNFSTYFGGDGTDVAFDAMRDGTGNIYLAGSTSSQNVSGFASSGAHQTANGGSSGTFDSFIAKFNNGGTTKAWATFYGGEADDEAYGIDVSPAGDVYVAGFSFSVGGISTVGSHQPTADLGDEGFIAKFNTAGARQWGTFYGGPDDDRIWDISESSGTIFVTGQTSSTSAIATTGSYKSTNGGGDDAFASRFDANGVRQWATYFGGTSTDVGEVSAIDGLGNFYMAGNTASNSGIALSGHQSTYGGAFDAYVAKFEQGSLPTAPPPTIASFTPSSGVVGSSVTITGSNFESTATSNIVYFGATKAIPSGGGASSLTVPVPNGGTFQPISVTNLAGLTGTSARPFVATLTGSSGLSATSFAKNDLAGFTTPYGVVAGDFDLDGKADLAIANRGSNVLHVGRNTSTSGNITFATGIPLTTFSQPIYPLIADIDGDGKLDLAVNGEAGATAVSLFRNTSSAPGSISFGAKIDVAPSTAASVAAMADIDGDGKPELAVTNAAGTVSVFRNSSAIGAISMVTPAQTFTSGASSYGISISDIDGDGKKDIVVANSSGVSVLRNTSTTGSISFALKADFALASAKDIATGDFDGDGKTDIATSNGVVVSVFRNTSSVGSITMAPRVDLTPGSGPAALGVDDLDGDGKVDLVVLNNTANTLSVFKNNSTSGSLSFGTKLDFATGTAPIGALAIVDLDGDGKKDLAVTNTNASSISTLRNNITVGSSEPTAQPTALVLTPSATTISVSFTAATPAVDGYLVLRHTAAPGTPPTDGTVYTPGISTIGGASVVHAGAAVSFSDFGLTPSTTYHYAVYSFNGSGAGINYFPTGPLTGSTSTVALAVEPVDQPTFFTTVPSSTSIAGYFQAAASAPAGYIVLRGTTGSSVPSSDPVDGTPYSVLNTIGNATVVAVGTGTTFNDTGLTASTLYNYKIYSYNGSGGLINYRQNSPLTGSSNTLSGAAITEPTAPPTGFSATPSSTTMVVSFTASAPASHGYLAVRGTPTDPTTGIPVDANTYTLGQTLGNGTVAYFGSSTTFNDTGLTPGVTYFYRIYSYNGSSTQTNYRTASFASGNSTTVGLAAEPSAQPTALVLTPGETTVAGSFTAAAGAPAGYIVLRAAAAPDTPPVDGTTYPLLGTLGNAKVVASGSGTTFNDSGLDPFTTYNYHVFSFNGSGGTINYRQSFPLANLTATTAPGGAEPTAQPTSLVASNQTNASLTISFTAATGSPAGYIAVRAAGAAPTFVPIDNTTYALGPVTGGVIAFIGAGTSFEDSGLAANTTYHYRIFSYNGSGASINYLTSIAALAGTGATNNTPVTVASAFGFVDSGRTTDLYTVRYISSTVGFAGGSNGELIKTTNGGLGWGFVPNPASTKPIWNLFFTSATDGFAVGGTGLAMRTTNGGDAWSLITTPATGDLYATYMVPGTSTGYMVGASGYVQKTTNGGTTWTQLTSATSMTGSYYNTVYFKDVNEGFIAGPDGIVKTTNGGTSWTDVSNDAVTWFHFVSTALGYGVGVDGIIVKTTDGGSTWIAQDSGVGVTLWGAYFVDASNGFAVGEEGTVLKTTNGGTTWSPALDAADASTTLYSIHFGSSTSGAVVGESGFIGRAQAEPAALLVTTNYKTEIDKGGSTTVSISVPSSDAPRVSSVDFYVIGIVDDAEELDPTYIQPSSPNVGTYSVNISDALGDPIGYKYLFVVNYDGQFDPPPSLTTPAGYAYIKYAAPTNELKMTNLKAGNTESAYQMISVPLVLTNKSVGSVFNDEFGTYNRSVWRLFRITGTGTGATTSEMSTGDLEIGKAYWLITTEGGTVGVGEGKTFAATAESPYAYTFIDGFNPIGNPYNFDVNWASGATVKGLRSFNGTSWAGASTLEPFKGYFVESTTAGNYPLPLVGSFDGGRTKRFDFEQSTDSWQLNIVIEQGEFKNEMGQIGMHPNATLGIDAIDERVFPMPEFFKLPSLSIDRAEAGIPLEREVVPSAGNQIWEFTLAERDGSSEVTMRWDRALIASLGRDLYLFDEEQVALINMSTIESHVTKSNTRLKIITGDPAFVRSEVAFKNSRIGNVYPNPAGGSFFVPVAMPAAGEVQVRVFDMQGKEVASQMHFAPAGLQNISVSGLPEGIMGLYLVTTEAGNAERRVQKVIFK